MWLSVRFESLRVLRTIPNLVAGRDSEETIANVVELGGEVLDSRGDTLLIRPSYVVVRLDFGDAADVVVRRRPWDPASLPNVLVVSSDPRASINRYEMPASVRDRVDRGMSFPQFVFLLSLFYGFWWLRHPSW
jgi:hypothetical protein